MFISLNKHDINMSFILGKCKCGCVTDIPIRPTTKHILQLYKQGHNRQGKISPNSAHNGSDHPMWKGGRRTHSLGYIYIHKPEHPYCDHQGYVLEHRLIMEQHLGRYLTKDEIVHHINENVKDNRIENLQLVTRKEHTNLHIEKNGYVINQHGIWYKK